MYCTAEVNLDDVTIPGFILVTCPKCGLDYVVRRT